MKKNITIITAIILIISIVGIIFVVNRPYEPVSFIADGENYSATVEHGATLILNLDHESNSKEWSITDTPECFASDYSTAHETGTEFHIIALTDGDGVMTFQSIMNDGSIKNYQLALSISRHKRKYLQIDSISFTELK